jgi:hypothetical protein
MGELHLGGCGGQILVMALYVGEVQGIELGSKRARSLGVMVLLVDGEVGRRDVEVEQIVTTGER